MAEILIIKLGALGDLVQTDGAIRDIREYHRKDRITVMTTPPYQEFMSRCPWVDEVFIDPRASRFNVYQMMSLRRRIRERNFFRVYDLQQVGRTRFYYQWLFPGIDWLGDVPGCAWYLKRYEQTTCAADHFHRHLEIAGLETRHTLKPNVSWMAEDVGELLQEAEIKPGFVVIIPGASRSHEQKLWPYYRDLAMLVEKSGRQVVMVPGPDDFDVCRDIPGITLAPGGGYYDTFVLAGIVARSAYVVGNDTGPTHIAAHLGCSGLALFSNHFPAVSTGIQHTRITVFESDDLRNLTLDTVWEKVNRDLKSSVARED